jgi:hypothetical protein
MPAQTKMAGRIQEEHWRHGPAQAGQHNLKIDTSSI